MTATIQCGLCEGEIGPDITGRPMCYACGPREMMPPETRQHLAMAPNVMSTPADVEAACGKEPLPVPTTIPEVFREFERRRDAIVDAAYPASMPVDAVGPRHAGYVQGIARCMGVVAEYGQDAVPASDIYNRLDYLKHDVERKAACRADAPAPSAVLEEAVGRLYTLIDVTTECFRRCVDLPGEGDARGNVSDALAHLDTAGRLLRAARSEAKAREGQA